MRDAWPARIRRGIFAVFVFAAMTSCAETKGQANTSEAVMVYEGWGGQVIRFEDKAVGVTCWLLNEDRAGGLSCIPSKDIGK